MDDFDLKYQMEVMKINKIYLLDYLTIFKTRFYDYNKEGQDIILALIRELEELITTQFQYFAPAEEKYQLSEELAIKLLSTKRRQEDDLSNKDSEIYVYLTHYSPNRLLNKVNILTLQEKLNEMRLDYQPTPPTEEELNKLINFRFNEMKHLIGDLKAGNNPSSIEELEAELDNLKATFEQYRITRFPEETKKIK